MLQHDNALVLKVRSPYICRCTVHMGWGLQKWRHTEIHLSMVVCVSPALFSAKLTITWPSKVCKVIYGSQFNTVKSPLNRLNRDWQLSRALQHNRLLSSTLLGLGDSCLHKQVCINSKIASIHTYTSCSIFSFVIGLCNWHLNAKNQVGILMWANYLYHIPLIHQEWMNECLTLIYFWSNV